MNSVVVALAPKLARIVWAVLLLRDERRAQKESHCKPTMVQEEPTKPNENVVARQVQISVS
jgi:hypothetical protein